MTQCKFKVGDKVRYINEDKVGTVKRVTWLPLSSEPCYEVKGFEWKDSMGLTHPSLEAEHLLINAE